MSETRTQLLTVEQFRELARPTSVHLDEREVNAFIREAEDSFIIPFLGYGNFKAAAEGISSLWDDSFDDTFTASLLLDGGEWEDSKGVLHYCNGVRKALAYFTYARMLRADGSIITRSGNVRHRDEYADHDEDPKRNRYNDTMDMAERYLSECMAYCKEHKKDKKIRKMVSSRSSIRAIGD